MQAFNTDTLLWAFNQSGYSVNALAGRLDINNNTLEDLLRGTADPAELKVSTLFLLADLLGVPVRSLFTEAETEHQEPGPADTAPLSVSDADQLVACIYDNGRSPTSAGEAAAAFEWDMDRLREAATEANRRLHHAGLRLIHTHGELSIVPINDHSDAKKALTNRHITERGLTFAHYKAAFQLVTEQPVTVGKTSTQRRRILGGLANIGAVTDVLDPALSDDALQAFL